MDITTENGTLLGKYDGGDPAQAVQAMLADTGYTAKYVDDSTLAVKESAPVTVVGTYLADGEPVDVQTTQKIANS